MIFTTSFSKDPNSKLAAALSALYLVLLVLLSSAGIPSFIAILIPTILIVCPAVAYRIRKIRNARSIVKAAKAINDAAKKG